MIQWKKIRLITRSEKWDQIVWFACTHNTRTPHQLTSIRQRTRMRKHLLLPVQPHGNHFTLAPRHHPFVHLKTSEKKKKTSKTKTKRRRKNESERDMGNSFCMLCGCIDQASVGIVERWGRFEKLAEPGLHFFNPCAGQWLAGILSTRINSLDVRIETKTKVSFLFTFVYHFFF